MKIISTPNNRFTCQHCKTVAEYDDNDIKLKKEMPGYDEYEMREVYYVTCPHCATPHTVSATAHQKQNVAQKNKAYY